MNPKDLIGSTKVPLSAIPPVATAHEACALLDGELKYGFRNWRKEPVSARIYVDAAKRHLDAWLECEEFSSDSGVHHLGHARATCGILLDAQANGTLIDDRISGKFPEVLAGLADWVKKRREKAAK
jgi:hypothetical protein